MKPKQGIVTWSWKCGACGSTGAIRTRRPEERRGLAVVVQAIENQHLLADFNCATTQETFYIEIQRTVE